MSYIPIELLLKSYETLSMLTDDHKQGQTQITSAVRHLVAFDKYYKANEDNCDLSSSENRDVFVENVRSVVNISGDYYTTNFYTTIKPLEDCGVGSNFFSAGVVNNSKQNTTYSYDYPTRGQNPLFRVKNNVLIRDVGYYRNVRNYLKTEKIRCAFVVWLLRNNSLSELTAHEIKKRLKTFQTEELVDAIMPKDENMNAFIEGYELTPNPVALKVSDLLALFKAANELTNMTDKYRSYLTAIQTKPFLLLAGISGTGKSRIVRELAFKSCPKYLQDKDGTTPGNYCMIEVKPNWHDSTELLGYYSNLSKSYQFKKFVKFLVKAKLNPDVPFFICLDEMNLAPVEHYFAEILSILETRKHPKKRDSDEVDMDVIKTGPIVESQYFKELAWKDTDGALHQKADMSDKDWYEFFFDVSTMSEDEKKQIAKYQYARTLQTEGLTLPDNVIIIGTVNMDDTTHQFSRKVIDRAMTIEMNGGKLRDMYGGSKDLEYLDEAEQQKWQTAFKQRYVTADEVLKVHQEVAEDIMKNVPERLENINKALKGTPFEVSYRVLNELTIMIGVMLDEQTGEDLESIINRAIDRILLMKILPRIEGDADMFKLKEAVRVGEKTCHNRLEWLKELAPQIESAKGEEHQQTAREKIQEMIDRMENQEFTRFWP